MHIFVNTSKVKKYGTKIIGSRTNEKKTNITKINIAFVILIGIRLIRAIY